MARPTPVIVPRSRSHRPRHRLRGLPSHLSLRSSHRILSTSRSSASPRYSTSRCNALISRRKSRISPWSSPTFFRLLVQSSVPSFSRLFLPVPRSSSSANRFPVRVVIRSCGAHVLHRAAPTPKSLVLDLNAGQRAPPAVRGRLRRDAAAAAAGNGRSGVGRVFESRRRPAFRCRAASVATFALPRAGVRSSGTSPDRRRRYCAASARPSPCGGTSIDPSLAAVARKSASDRVQIAVTAGRAAGTGTDSRLPRWRFTNDRRPRLLTLLSIVRPPLSFHRLLVISSFVVLSGAVRRPVPQ